MNDPITQPRRDSPKGPAAVCPQPAARNPQPTTRNPLLNSPRGFALALAAVLAVWLALRIAFFEGFYASDDFIYVRYAWLWPCWPRDYWECRILYNGLMRACFLLLGYGPLPAALPGMLGSLMVLGGVVWLGKTLWRSAPLAIAAGLLAACIPQDVLCTSPNGTKTLATGLFTLALCFLLGGRRLRSAAAAGVLLALGVWAHEGMLYFAGIIPLGVLLTMPEHRRRGLAMLAVAAGAFLALELGVYGLWTGDPLYRYHVMARTYFSSLDVDKDARLLLLPGGGLNLDFFWRPVKDFLFCKSLGPLGAATAVIGALTWRRRTAPCKALLAALLIGWAWMSFGTQRPFHYQAFPGTISYWQPMTPLLALIAAELLTGLAQGGIAGIAASGHPPAHSLGGALADATPARTADGGANRSATSGTLKSLARGCILAAIVIICVALPGLSGPWGQNIKVSRDLLAYVNEHPHATFVADDWTLRDFLMIRAFSPAPNVLPTPASRLFPQEIRPIPPADSRVLVNPLHERPQDPSLQWVHEHAGPTIYSTPPGYRPLTYLLPEEFRCRHAWTIRYPSGSVCGLNGTCTK